MIQVTIKETVEEANELLKKGARLHLVYAIKLGESEYPRFILSETVKPVDNQAVPHGAIQ